MDLQVGSTVGDYQIVEVLGAGGMGKVYKVRNVISDRIEAMKVLLPDLANAPELADRFMREIKVQASLEHPNIAGLYTALRVDNQLLMLMEFVEGVTLEQRMKQGPIPPAQAVDYMRQVLAALEFAHSRGVIHRDIKPANMMLTPTGVVKLMDFGIAKAANDHRLTMTGTTLGSLYYMSPEQIQGAATLDGRADLYSAGVSLYELVTGKRPFDGTSQFEIMSAHLNQQPLPPLQIDPQLPPALNDVILMAVGKDPETRFQTATAFRNALANVFPASEPAVAPVSTGAPQRMATVPNVAPPMPAPSPQKSRRGLWMAVGAIVMAGVVVALVQLGPWHGTKAAPAIPESKPAASLPPVQPPVQTPPPAVDTPKPPEPTPAAAIPTAPPPPAVAKPAASQPKSIHAQIPAQPVNPTAAPNQVPAAPAQVTPAAPQPTAPIQQAPQQQPTAPPVNRAELQETREQLVMLGARAGGIRSSLTTLQRSQAASGLNLRGDMQEAASLMDSFLQGANSALNAGDVASAKNFMEKAERQVEKLEKFLNR